MDQEFVLLYQTYCEAARRIGEQPMTWDQWYYQYMTDHVYRYKDKKHAKNDDEDTRLETQPYSKRRAQETIRKARREKYEERDY
jgi:hypothetical protein